MKLIKLSVSRLANNINSEHIKSIDELIKKKTNWNEYEEIKTFCSQQRVGKIDFVCSLEYFRIYSKYRISQKERVQNATMSKNEIDVRKMCVSE